MAPLIQRVILCLLHTVLGYLNGLFSESGNVLWISRPSYSQMCFIWEITNTTNKYNAMVVSLWLSLCLLLIPLTLTLYVSPHLCDCYLSTLFLFLSFCLSIPSCSLPLHVCAAFASSLILQSF